MSLRNKLIGYLLLAAFIQINAQNTAPNPCGTRDGKVEWLADYQLHKTAFPRSEDLLLVPIKIHVVGTDQGTGYFDVQRILDAFCTLNNDFADADIQFYIDGSLHYIGNDNFYRHTWGQGGQMMNQNNVNAVINCYIVADPVGNCGYSNYGSGIALNKGCLGPNDHTWAHEVGHFLSLPHTFYGWELDNVDNDDNSQPAPTSINGQVVEKTDGSNCQYAADGFCDTPPDYLDYRWSCNSNAESNVKQHDPDGVEFRSDGTLIMSYSNDQCVTRFSEEQMDAMRANVMTDRSYLLGQDDPSEPLTEALLNPVSPVEGTVVEQFENVFFEWEQVAGARSYLLEISPLPSFSIVLYRYQTDDPFYTVHELDQGRNYYWRIRPYNQQFTCKTLSESSRFSTGTVSSVNIIEEINGLTLQPNPVFNDRDLRISLQAAAALRLDGSLLTLTGQLVQQFSWELQSGQNQMLLETSGLRAGIYLLQLRSEKGVVSRKVILQ